ncbi:MAG: Pyruvate carboxyltransferase protein [Dehalococcoidia bacterium]|nr:Pyruvate carboxyltransferase protein [Dehalococcoidia bacterium]
MAQFAVNPNKQFHNSGGKMPPVFLEEEPARLSPEKGETLPKLITDTTLRDGAQDPNFALFPAEARVRYYDLLHKLDNGTGRIEQVEVFIYQKRDVWCLEQLLERGYDFPQVTTWTRATPKDIKLMAEVTGGRVKETGMLASSSDHHIFDKLSYRSKEEAIEKYLQPIMTAMELGVTPRVHLEDATKADIFGFVIPFIQRTLTETQGKAKFRLCDTLGVGVPDPYASLPQGVPRLVETVIRETGAQIEWHGHNDFGHATSNSVLAWRYGARRVNVAFGGLGERTGNTTLEQMVANYIRYYGDPGFDLGALLEIADLISSEVTPIHVKAPIIGPAIFTTQAGIHQSGVQRQQHAEGGDIYLPFSPELLGSGATELHRVGALSGAEGIIALLNQKAFEATGKSETYSTSSRAVKYVYDKLQDAYDGEWDEREHRYLGARTTFFAAEELYALALEYEAGKDKG